MFRELFDHRESVERNLGRVMQDMQPNEPAVKLPIFQMLPHAIDSRYRTSDPPSQVSRFFNWLRFMARRR